MGIYDLYCHITYLRLQDEFSANCIDVLGQLYPFQYIPVHNGGYNHFYKIDTFGHNKPNPILLYNNSSFRPTENGKIDMSYLKALIDLQSKRYGISNCLHKTIVYKCDDEHNLTLGVSEVLRKRKLTKQMGSETEQKLHDK